MRCAVHRWAEDVTPATSCVAAVPHTAAEARADAHEVVPPPYTPRFNVEGFGWRRDADFLLIFCSGASASLGFERGPATACGRVVGLPRRGAVVFAACSRFVGPQFVRGGLPTLDRGVRGLKATGSENVWFGKGLGTQEIWSQIYTTWVSSFTASRADSHMGASGPHNTTPWAICKIRKIRISQT